MGGATFLILVLAAGLGGYGLLVRLGLPDREAWLWPASALLFGLALGGLFAEWGYPAAALAHMVVNGVGFLRLTSRNPTEG